MKAVRCFLVAATMLLLLSTPVYAAEFPDVPKDSYMENAVEFLYDRGIVQGYEEGSFRPDNPITRAEFAVMLCSLTGAQNSETASVTFPDTESHWAKPFISAAAERGYMMGYDDGLFYPNNKLTFEQASVVAMRILDPEDDCHSQGAWYQGYVDKAVSSGYTQGMNTDVGLNLSRGDAAILLYNISTHFSDGLQAFSYEDQNTGYVYRDFSENNGGAFSVCITSEALGNHHLRQTAAVEPNTSYIISADIKTKDVTASNDNSSVEGACISAQSNDLVRHNLV